MKPLTDLEYVEYYAQLLSADPSLFSQQARLVSAQLQGSRTLFTNWFKGKDFKVEARKYLKGRGLI